jgi:hypothetical protein
MVANDLVSDTSASHCINDTVTERFLTRLLSDAAIIEPLPREIIYQEWQLITIGIALLFLALIRFGSRTFFSNMQRAFFSLPLFRQMLRDNELFSQGSIIPLALVNILITATFLYNITDFTGSEFVFAEAGLPAKILKLILVMVIYYILQYFILRLTGLIFKTGNATLRHLSVIHYYQSVSSIALIPVLIFSIYSTSSMLLFVSVILWLIIFMIRLSRGLIIVIDVRGYSGFQNFLYICALEILPVLLLIKLIVV